MRDFVIAALVGACLALAAIAYDQQNMIATYSDFMKQFDCADLNRDHIHDQTGEFMD